MSSHFYSMPVRRDGVAITRFKPHPGRVWTTFNAGTLVPLWVKEMLPGDNRVVIPSFAIRSQTPVRPVMDDAVFDLQLFYVPNRILMDDWVSVMGENKSSYWAVNTAEHLVPKVTATGTSGGGFPFKSVADYMGVPPKVRGLWVNALPFRAYVRIFNDYFRSQDLQPPAACPTNSTNVDMPSTPSVIADPWQSAYRGCALFPVCRLPDYFSTCTPGPLKSTSQVSLRLADVPVLDDPDGTKFRPSFWSKDGSTYDLTAGKALGTEQSDTSANGQLAEAGDNLDGTQAPVYQSLKAMVSNSAITINDLRFAVQLQKLLERDLFGTRYTEILQSHFGVKAADSRLQRPELYGWQRYRLNQQQVVQTSASGSSGTPQGNTAAYSLTVGVPKAFKVPSPEHGFLIALGCIRVLSHTYSQGLDRFWHRRERYDYYWNEFQGLGNQAVMATEIFAGADADRIFGYQEYAADYRYNVNKATGEMRPTYITPLDSWHYAEKYDSVPSLDATWIQDNSKALIDKTLAVQSTTADQFFGVFDFGGHLDTEVPMYSIPGFVDHF